MDLLSIFAAPASRPLHLRPQNTTPQALTHAVAAAAAAAACRLQFIKGDIQSMDLLSFVLLTEQIDTVMHFAAQVRTAQRFRVCCCYPCLGWESPALNRMTQRCLATAAAVAAPVVAAAPQQQEHSSSAAPLEAVATHSRLTPSCTSPHRCAGDEAAAAVTAQQ
jgi:hypothetical protein